MKKRNTKTKKVVRADHVLDFRKFLEKKEIIILISNPNKRQDLEFIFQHLDARASMLFLADLVKMTGTAGEWKILSEKLKNKQLKAVAAKKHEELKKKPTIINLWEGPMSDLEKIEIYPPSTSEQPVQKERKETKSLLSFLSSLLGKKSA